MSSTQSETVTMTETAQTPAGTMLRKAREVRGESLEEVAHALKLSMRQLVAIESGHYEILPGPAFVRGFVRNYARHLGLDPEAVLAAVGAEASAAVDLTPVSNAEGDMPANRGFKFNVVPAAVVAGLLLVLISAGGYFGWFETPTQSEVDVIEPGMAPMTQSEAEEALAASAPVAVELDQPLAEPAAALVAVPESATPPAPAAAAAPVVPPVADPAVSAGEPVDAAAPAADAPPPLRFVFSGESWVEVKDASGAILFSGIGIPGSSRTVQGAPPFALVIGNARSVRLEFNGKPVDLVPHTKVSVARLTVQ
ncbi:MAG: helix-turn-helix domain-containing protein [Azoarcus sp. PHD]|nr:MAG: helix-turn-helix domain-containing protein [Azoarcus sp. PHD]